jgi:hypothetical protein
MMCTKAYERLITRKKNKFVFVLNPSIHAN